MDGWMDTNSPSTSWFPLGPGEVWLPEIPRIAQLRTASAGAGTAGSAVGSGAGDEARRRWGFPFSPNFGAEKGPNSAKQLGCLEHHSRNDRRKFRSQTSDNMERWKAEQGRGTEKRKIRREKIRRERVRGQTLHMREKVGKSRNTVFFQWFVAPEGRKVGSLKRQVRSQLATGAMQNCTPLWREAHFQVKMHKTPGVRTTFGSWDVEKVHAVVARSTFPSQNVQNTSAPDHFWKLRCRKSARRCGAKHISKSKCTKH